MRFVTDRDEIHIECTGGTAIEADAKDWLRWREIALMVDSSYCDLHNKGQYLTGNTQASDLEWLARVLFEASNLGAGDIRTTEWLIGWEQWEQLGLTKEALMGDGPRRFDQMTADQQDAWIKLARIVLYVIPIFADRVGRRWTEQAKALKKIWHDESKKAPPTKRHCAACDNTRILPGDPGAPEGSIRREDMPCPECSG